MDIEASCPCPLCNVVRLMYMEINQDYYLIIVLSSKHLFSSGYAKVPRSPTPTAVRTPKSDSEIRRKPLGQGSDVAEGLFLVQECAYQCLPVLRVLCGTERSLSASLAEVPSASTLQVLRRLASIFTSVYAAVQKLKKDSWLELQFNLADNSKLNVRISSKEITPQLSFNHLVIPQARTFKIVLMMKRIQEAVRMYLNDLEKEYQARALLAKSKRFFRKCASHLYKLFMVKNKGLIAEAYEWDEEEVSSDENEIVEVKVLMALAEENNVVGKESARNGEWVKISMRKCDIRKPIWYMDSGYSRHIPWLSKSYGLNMLDKGLKWCLEMTSTLHNLKFIGSIKCNGIVFTKVAFVNGLKYNLISISQLCDAKYIVQFDEKRGTIFNSNKEIVMIAPRVRDVYVLDVTSSAQESCFLSKASENLN
ncbi:hypothetical protein Tco_0367785 [Tanacetum coccineum]